ncbi:MAG: BatD family protein [Candidatus Margulisiibacteriota bacterium]
MVKKISILLFILSLSIFSQDFEIQSSVSKSKVYKNERFLLSLTVKGADKDVFKSIKLPNFQKDFSIVSSSQSSSFSFINGVSNRTREYQYVLIPINSGIYIIDPFQIIYDGKSYATKPLRVVVRDDELSQSQQQQAKPISRLNSSQSIPQNKSNSIFLDTQVSTNNIFIGESINYSVKLYRRISLWSSISINQDDLLGVWQTSIDTKPEQMVRKFGQRYYELELTHKEIQPLNIGELAIPPLTARFVVDPFTGEYQLQSKMVTINVKPLPEPKPASFTGAIGNYEMTTLIPEQPPSQNTFQIQLIIEGQGNLSSILPPVIQDTNAYRVLTAPKNNIEESDAKQIFDYVIIPKSSGTIDIPPIEFSYFSKEKMSYISLTSEPFQFEVSINDIAFNPQRKNFKEDIQFLIENTVFITFISHILNKGFSQALTVLNALILISLLIILTKSKLQFKKPSPAKKKRSLIRRIHNLRQASSIQEMETLFIEVLKHFTNYNQPSVQSKRIEEALYNTGFSDALIKSAMQWIKNTQMLQFSKDKQDDQIHSMSESLKRILKEIIKETGKNE